MEQRTLRLGDMVDDYCPRERRITNHAVVALVGDEIRQTRCTTCDGEHVYKHGRAPRLRTSKDGASDAGAGQLVPRAAAKADQPPVAAHGNGDAARERTPADPQPPGSPEVPPADAGDDVRGVDGWLAHRPLIRATLPRTEGEPPTPRPIPVFTMHQRAAHGARPFRHGQGRPGGSGQPPNGFGGGGFGHDRNGNHGNPGNGHGHPGPGGGRPRRRRGGRHKPPR